MAKRKLERSIIEGGRYLESKVSRRLANHNARTGAKQALRAAMRDPESWDDVDISPGRKRTAPRYHFDRLGPLERWLVSRDACKWNDVYADLRAMFDSRSVAGWHALIHAVPVDAELLREGWTIHRYFFRVDGSGVLRARQIRLIRKYVFEVRWDTKHWMGERRVMQRRGRCFWLEPVQRDDVGQPRYRQGRALSLDEEKRVRRMNDPERKAFVVNEA